MCATPSSVTHCFPGSLIVKVPDAETGVVVAAANSGRVRLGAVGCSQPAPSIPARTQNAAPIGRLMVVSCDRHLRMALIALPWGDHSHAMSGGRTVGLTRGAPRRR